MDLTQQNSPKTITLKEIVTELRNKLTNYHRRVMYIHKGSSKKEIPLENIANKHNSVLVYTGRVRVETHRQGSYSGV